MVLWLPLDTIEHSVITLVASTPNLVGGNQGILTGDFTGVSGKVAFGLCFDGSSNKVEVADYSAINIGLNNFSLGAWIKPTPPAAGTLVIMEKQSAGYGSRGYSFFLFDGELRCVLDDWKGGPKEFASSMVVPLGGNWHHVALTVERKSQTGGIFYLDGSPVATFDPTSRSGPLGNPAPFRVGSHASSPSGYFVGCIDEVEVFGRALSSQEICGMWSAGAVGRCQHAGKLPEVSYVCPSASSVNVKAQILNASSATKTYDYVFQPLPGASGCAANGPQSFSPDSGIITVQRGKWGTILVQITKGLVPCGQRSCYELIVQVRGTTEVLRYQGAIVEHCSLCTLSPLGPGSVLTGVGSVLGPFQLTNTLPTPALLPYRFVVFGGNGALDTGVVRLNGLAPGSPVQGMAALAPGETATFNLTVQFVSADPLQEYTVALQGDVNGDGNFVTLGTTTLTNIIPEGCPGPQITQQPVGQNALTGRAVSLSVGATGTGTIAYQWRKNGSNLSDGAGISGTQGPVLTIGAAALADAGSYDVVLTDDCGPSTSTPAVLTVLLDSDGDGIPDAWEIARGFNPGNASDALLDADGDGRSNLEEYLAGTDPLDARSRLQIDAIEAAGAGAVLRFTLQADRTYTIQYKDLLTDPAWLKLIDIGAQPAAGPIQITDPGPLGPSRFYRVLTPQQP